MDPPPPEEITNTESSWWKIQPHYELVSMGTSERSGGGVAAGRAVDRVAFISFTRLRSPSDSLNQLLRQVCSCSDATAGPPEAKPLK